MVLAVVAQIWRTNNNKWKIKTTKVWGDCLQGSHFSLFSRNKSKNVAFKVRGIYLCIYICICDFKNHKISRIKYLIGIHWHVMTCNHFSQNWIHKPVPSFKKFTKKLSNVMLNLNKSSVKSSYNIPVEFRKESILYHSSFFFKIVLGAK